MSKLSKRLLETPFENLKPGDYDTVITALQVKVGYLHEAVLEGADTCEALGATSKARELREIAGE